MTCAAPTPPDTTDPGGPGLPVLDLDAPPAFLLELLQRSRPRRRAGLAALLAVFFAARGRVSQRLTGRLDDGQAAAVVDTLLALAANGALVERLLVARQRCILDAVTAGVTGAEIGRALRMSRDELTASVLAAVEKRPTLWPADRRDELAARLRSGAWLGSPDGPVAF